MSCSVTGSCTTLHHVALLSTSARPEADASGSMSTRDGYCALPTTPRQDLSSEDSSKHIKPSFKGHPPKASQPQVPVGPKLDSALAILLGTSQKVAGTACLVGSKCR